MVIYVVENGDTLWDISSRYGVELNKVIEINELKFPDNLVVGQTIVLPIDSFVYTWNIPLWWIIYIEYIFYFNFV